MRRQFLNVRPPEDAPATLTVPFGRRLYRARVLHAELDHDQPPPSRRPAPFRHDHYHIVLVTAGKGTFVVDDRRYAVQPGVVFFTAPPQAHSFFNAPGETARYAEITFEWLADGDGRRLDASFDALLRRWTNQPCRAVLHANVPDSFRRLFLAEVKGLVDLAGARPAPTSLELNRRLAAVLELAYTHVFRSEPAVEEPLERVRDHILAHFHEELGLGELAAMAGLTANYFSRRFKQRFGRAPIDYQIDLRLRAACQLLRATDEPLRMVAHRVGFADPYYFARLFARRIGESPGRYRLGVSGANATDMGRPDRGT